MITSTTSTSKRLWHCCGHGDEGAFTAPWRLKPEGWRMPTTECGGAAMVKKSFWLKVALLQNVPTQALPRTSSRMSYPIEGVVKPTILVVDDTPDNLSLMRELLRKDYQVQLANGG